MAAAAVQGIDLAASLRNRLQLVLDLHAAAGVPITQQALSLFVTALCLVKVSHQEEAVTLPTLYCLSRLCAWSR